MRILLVGSGGREHALAFKLAEYHEVICAPGNPGIAQDVDVVPIPATDYGKLVELAVARSVDLAVIGPEDPLIAGLGDRFREAGIPTFGPSQAAAQLEGSKAFSKRLMHEAGVPTAQFESFVDPVAASDYAKRSFDEGRRLAVKTSGNALGKGVTVCERLEEALEAIEAAMVDKVFGEAGETLVLEEKLMGREFSVLTLVGSQNFLSLPIAQDYKRALDGDRGANTGGMGGYSPCTWVSDEIVKEVEATMVSPVLERLAAEGSPFSGVLFTGVMLTESGPMCLEYNVRFGDPETESVLLRVKGDLGLALYQTATGQFIEPLPISDLAAVTVVVASGGYPGSYAKGNPIAIGQIASSAKLFFAGVSEKDGRLVTSGGRVFAASATGSTIEDARAAAYSTAKTVSFEGSYFRGDIASKSD